MPTVSVQLSLSQPLLSTSLYFIDSLDEFSSCDKVNPNCVVMGDCQEHFTYDALNKAFTTLINLDPANRKLFSLGAGYVV